MKKGFTLIELLITISILSILFALGFAGFRDFSRRQELEGVARQFRGDLSQAVEYAASGYKPAIAGCPAPAAYVLDGYHISNSGGTYSIDVICSGTTVPIKTVTLPTGYTITRTYVGGAPLLGYLVIKPLRQGTNLVAGSEDDFLVSDSVGNTTTVVLTPAGEIK